MERPWREVDFKVPQPLEMMEPKIVAMCRGFCLCYILLNWG